MTRRQFLRAAGAMAFSTAAAACSIPAARVPVSTPTKSPSQATTSIAGVPAEPGGLRALADNRKFRLGSALSNTLFDSDKRRKLLEIYRRDFNFATLHSGFYWTAWEPERGQISRSKLDDMKRQVDAMLQAGVTDLRGHPLIFPMFEPEWLTSGMKKGAIKKAEAIDIMVKHIRDVMTPFKGMINEWVVVNEPFRFYESDRGDYFKLVIGEDYVDMAFKAARETDPQAKLMLNDYDTHAISGRNYYESNKDPIIYNKVLIDRLKAKGLVDSIGTQMHISEAKSPKIADMLETWRSFGVPVHITELDVNLKDTSAIKNSRRFEQQAKVYGLVMEAALQSDVCESLCLWEFGDKYSWLEDPYFSFASPIADATPWDDDLQPKPAYVAMRQALRKASP